MSASTREIVGMTLGRTARMWRNKLDERLSPLGLTQARWLVLMHLSRMGGERSLRPLWVWRARPSCACWTVLSVWALCSAWE